MNAGARNKLGVVVGFILIICVAAPAAAYELARSSLDGGGAMRTVSASFECSGAIGQHDAGAMAGGGYDLVGGFWFGEPLGDCDATGTVDQFDYEDFFGCQNGPGVNPGVAGCDCLDLDSDGDVDLIDFAEFAVAFEE